MFNMPSGPKLSLALVALLSVLFGVMFVTTQKQQAKQEALKKAAAKAAAENEAAFNNLSPAEHLAQAKKLLNVDASQASVSDGLKHIAAIDQGSPLLKDATTVLPGLDMSMFALLVVLSLIALAIFIASKLASSTSTQQTSKEASDDHGQAPTNSTRFTDTIPVSFSASAPPASASVSVDPWETLTRIFPHRLSAAVRWLRKMEWGDRPEGSEVAVFWILKPPDCIGPMKSSS